MGVLGWFKRARGAQWVIYRSLSGKSVNADVNPEDDEDFRRCERCKRFNKVTSAACPQCGLEPWQGDF